MLLFPGTETFSVGVGSGVHSNRCGITYSPSLCAQTTSSLAKKRVCFFSLFFPPAGMKCEIFSQTQTERFLFSQRTQGKDLNFFSQPTLREFLSWRESACQPHRASECLEKGSANREHRVPPAGDSSLCSPATPSQCHPCLLSYHLVSVVSLLPLLMKKGIACLVYCVNASASSMLYLRSPLSREALEDIIHSFH